MGSSSETAPKTAKTEENVFARVGRVLSDTHARPPIFRVTLRPMRLPHNEAGAIRLPFGRNDGEDRLKLFQRPQALVRKATRDASQLFGHFLGALRGGMRNVASRMKQHQEHMNDVRAHRLALRKDRKVLLPWARKRRKGRANDGSSLLTWKGSPQAMAMALMEKGKALETEMNVRGALECYEEANRILPGQSEILSMCSKAWSDMTYLDEIHRLPHKEVLTDEQKRDVNTKAISYCEQAIEADPTHGLPHVACCISMGRMALFSDNKGKVALAKTARDHAVIALEKAPQMDLAHHLMGRWHWEMAQLNSIVRTLIRLVYGTSLASGSFTEALECYRKAAELNPSRLVHKVEVGRSLARMGKKAEALEELSTAVELPVEDINAYLQREDAIKLIHGLERSLPQRNSAEMRDGSDGNAGELPGWPINVQWPPALQVPKFQFPWPSEPPLQGRPGVP